MKNNMIRKSSRFVTVNKYNAKKCSEDGITFDSLRERKRYQELKFLQKIGEIKSLEVHPVYPLIVNGFIVCKMLPDFRYIEQGKIVVEDVKSNATITDVYRIKKKLIFALYAIEIKEILH